MLLAILFYQIYHSKIFAVLVVIYPRGFVDKRVFTATKVLF